MSEVTCQIRKILNPEVKSVTVGERLQLHCESVSPWSDDKSLTLSVPEDLKYHFRQIQGERISDKKAEFAVVSFVVGNHRFEQLSVDGKTLAPFSLHVASVQDLASPAKEPYGPFLLGSQFPPLLPITLILFLIVLGIVASFVPWYKKSRFQKKLASFNLKTRQDLSPTEEFFRLIKDIKKHSALWNETEMNKESDEVKDLYAQYFRALQVLIGRVFNWPMTEHSLQDQKNFIIKIGTIDHESARELAKLWFETERIRNYPISGKDLLFMMDWSLRLVPSLTFLKRLHG